MLREAGYRQRSSDRDLICVDSANDVEFFYLRPRDIATYVGSGDLALGITGRDLLLDVEEQVAPGDAEREVTGAHVGGDVARAQVEELDVVGAVDADEVAVGRALPVTGLPQHLRGGLGQRPLVGDGDAQHGPSPTGTGR